MTLKRQSHFVVHSTPNLEEGKISNENIRKCELISSGFLDRHALPPSLTQIRLQRCDLLHVAGKSRLICQTADSDRNRMNDRSGLTIYALALALACM